MNFMVVLFFSVLLNTQVDSSSPNNMEIKTLRAKVDSMEIQIEKLSIEKQYFDSLINNQTSTYLIIVSLIFGLSALINFIQFRSRIASINAKLKEETIQLQTKLDKFEIEFSNIIKRNATFAGNNYGLISEKYMKEGNFIDAYYFSISCVKNHFKAIDKNFKEHDEYLKIYLTNLDMARDIFDKKVANSPSLKDEFIKRQEKKNVFKVLDEMFTLDNEESREKISSFRVAIKKYIN